MQVNFSLGNHAAVAAAFGKDAGCKRSFKFPNTRQKVNQNLNSP